MSTSPSTKLLWYVARADLSDSGDAATLHSREDVRALRRCGWDARLVSSASGMLDTPDGVVETAIQRKGAPLERFRFELSLISSLIRSRQRPAFLLFRGPSNLILLAWVVHRMGIPFGVELNGLLPYRYKKKTNLRDLFERLADQFFMRHSSLIVAVTEELSRIASNESRCNDIVVTARNGVNTDEIKPVAQEQSDFDLLIGFLGKAYEGRGLDVVLDVVHALKRRGIRAGFRAVGGGPKIEELRRRASLLEISDAVSFVSSVDPTRMAEAVAACHLMWGYYEEGPHDGKSGLSPLKLWTYLALAKPVFLRNIKILESYRDIPGVLWMNGSDSEELAEELHGYLLKLGLSGLSRCGSEGREYVERYVSWDKHGELISDAVRSVLAARRETTRTRVNA